MDHDPLCSLTTRTLPWKELRNLKLKTTSFLETDHSAELQKEAEQSTSRHEKSLIRAFPRHREPQESNRNTPGLHPKPQTEVPYAPGVRPETTKTGMAQAGVGTRALLLRACART